MRAAPPMPAAITRRSSRSVCLGAAALRPAAACGLCSPPLCMARGTARGVSCAALCGASSLALAAALAPLAVQPHHADCSCSSAVCKCGGGPRRESGRVQPAAAGGRRGGRRGRRRPAAGRRRAAERASAVHGVPLRACTALRRAVGQLQGFQGVSRTGSRALRVQRRATCSSTEESRGWGDRGSGHALPRRGR